MILAALGDIHGNRHALENVLHAIDEEGIQTIVCTGDCAAGFPDNNAVIASLRERAIPTVQGEWDRLTVRFLRKNRGLRERMSGDELAALSAAYAACTSASIEYLRGLPKTLTLTVDGIEIAVCHGTLTSQSGFLSATDPDERFQRQREINPAAIIVYGGTHVPHHRFVDGTLFVNPGPVAYGGHYAIVSTEGEPWTVEHRVAD